MESLLAQSNPLLSMALMIDIDNLEKENVKDVKGMLLFNDNRLDFNTDLKITKTEKSFTLSMELDLDLGQIGIYAPRPEPSVFFLKSSIHNQRC